MSISVSAIHHRWTSRFTGKAPECSRTTKSVSPRRPLTSWNIALPGLSLWVFIRLYIIMMTAWLMLAGGHFRCLHNFNGVTNLKHFAISGEMGALSFLVSYSSRIRSVYWPSSADPVQYVWVMNSQGCSRPDGIASNQSSHHNSIIICPHSFLIPL